MRYGIIVEPTAKRDLFSIYGYIRESDSSAKAKKFLGELEQKIATLDLMPHRCRRSPYSDHVDARDLIFKGYTISFLIVEKNVHIIAVFRQHN